MNIYVNGEKTNQREGTVIADLITQLGLEKKRIAVELNKEILPHDQYSRQRLVDEDRLEIVQAIGGGEQDGRYGKRVEPVQMEYSTSSQ